MILVFATFILAFAAGFRAMLPLAVVSWLAASGHLQLADTWLAWLGFAYTPYILTVLAALELVGDKLPTTPSRKVPVQFATRIASGALCAAALGDGNLFYLFIGGLAAVAGTYVGAAWRAKLTAIFKNTLTAALLEDLTTILLIVIGFAPAFV